MDKPSYSIPSMQAIAMLPWNGYTVASLFSGCGGSSLGYKMAGFQVLWANEFIPAAQEVYRLNAPSTILDTRDIRRIPCKEVLAALDLQIGQLDLLDGSPPCAAFSTAGKRQKTWGKVKSYSDTMQRTDDLFFEFARFVREMQPKVFVAENVSGLVKGVAKGYFKEIFALLKACGYRVEARLLDAQWLGVPQMRQRIFFQGIRHDLGLAPAWPKPLPYRYSVREALPWIVRQAIANGIYADASQRPAATILASTGSRTSSTLAGEHLHMIETAILVEEANGFNSQYLGTHRLFDVSTKSMPIIQAGRPVDVVLRHAYRDKRGAFGHAGDITELPAPTILSGSVGTHWIEEEPDCHWNALDRRARIDDSCASAPTILQHDRGWNQLALPGATIRRKFTIAELKRICAFPDDFRLTGSYAQQWERLGRAVPPLMMFHLAQTIKEQIFDCLKT